MKKSIFLFVSILCIGNLLSAQKNKTIISGKITHPENSKVRLVNFCTYENLSLPEVELAKDNSFKLVFDLPENKYLRLEHGPQVADFFVMPGDSVFLSFDMVNMDSTLDASGPHAPHYFYWREHYNYTKNGNAPMHTKPDEMAILVDSVFKEKRKFVDNFVKKYQSQIDPAFVKHYEVAYTYRPLSKRYVFPFYYAMAKEMKVQDVQLSENYYLPIEKGKINIDENWNVLEYQNFLEEYVTHTYNQLLAKSGKPQTASNPLERYAVAKILLYGKGKWESIATMLDSDIRFEKNEGAFEAYHRFMVDCPNDFIKNKLSEAYKEVQIATNGKEMPNFSARNSKGEKVSLADFKGKVVLLDVWAMFCGPCWYEMRHENTAKLKAHFKDNPNVVFLYLCIDRSESRWKEVIQKEPFVNVGIHLYDDELSKGNAMEQMGVKMFPSYFIIDKEGKIFDSNPPRPSNPDLINVMEKALK